MARKPAPTKAQPDAESSKPATTNEHPAADALPVDPVSDALTRHDAQRKADEAELLADPGFQAAVEHGKRWELAQRAAAEASAPFRAELYKLIAEHPVFDSESDTARRFDALKWAIQDAEAKAYAQHGFTLAIPPKSPAELLARLKRVELNWGFDLQETTNLPRPSELLWQDAEGLRERDPSLPELPAKPDAGRARYVALVRWCEACARARSTNGNAATKALPARTEVVLWEGAAHTDRNIRLARTRSAYLEAHGDVPAAMKALEDAGNPVARSTFYNHLDALDVAIPRWRESVQLSNPTGNLDGMRNVGTRGKSRDKV